MRIVYIEGGNFS